MCVISGMDPFSLDCMVIHSFITSRRQEIIQYISMLYVTTRF